MKKGIKKIRRRDLIIWVTLGTVGGALIYGLLGRGWLEVAGLVAGYLIGLFIVLILWECFRKRGITFPKFLEKFRAKRLPVTLKEKIYLSVGGLVVCGAAVGIAYAWIEFLKGMGMSWPVLLLLGLPVFFGVFMLGLIVLNKIVGLTD